MKNYENKDGYILIPEDDYREMRKEIMELRSAAAYYRSYAEPPYDEETARRYDLRHDRGRHEPDQGVQNPPRPLAIAAGAARRSQQDPDLPYRKRQETGLCTHL